MPLRLYPPSVSALLASYFEKAVAKLKLTHPSQFEARESDAKNDVMDGILNAYDTGERREDRLIAAGLRRFQISDGSVSDDSGAPKRSREDGETPPV